MCVARDTPRARYPTDSALAQTAMTVEADLDWDLNGEMWAMVGAHTVHNRITPNLTVALGLRLRARFPAVGPHACSNR